MTAPEERGGAVRHVGVQRPEVEVADVRDVGTGEQQRAPVVGGWLVEGFRLDVVVELVAGFSEHRVKNQVAGRRASQLHLASIWQPVERIGRLPRRVREIHRG